MRRNANDPAASEPTGALRPQDSQDTLASLVQVDPTPIDADPDSLLGDSLDASASLKSDQSTSSLKSHTPSASALGLSGSGHGTVFYRKLAPSRLYALLPLPALADHSFSS